jgi:hypothetical protein
MPVYRVEWIPDSDPDAATKRAAIEARIKSGIAAAAEVWRQACVELEFDGNVKVLKGLQPRIRFREGMGVHYMRDPNNPSAPAINCTHPSWPEDLKKKPAACQAQSVKYIRYAAPADAQSVIAATATPIIDPVNPRRPVRLIFVQNFVDPLQIDPQTGQPKVLDATGLTISDLDHVLVLEPDDRNLVYLQPGETGVVFLALEGTQYPATGRTFAHEIAHAILSAEAGMGEHLGDKRNLLVGYVGPQPENAVRVKRFDARQCHTIWTKNPFVRRTGRGGRP